MAKLTLQMASSMIDTAVNKAKELGVPMAIAVVDEGGNLKAFRRMDGALLCATEIAINKAHTSASWGFPTDGLFEFIKGDEALLAGVPHIPRTVAFGGGVPVKMDNELVGGVGVSGGHWSQDVQCAQAAVEALR